MKHLRILILGLGQVVIGYDIDCPNKGIKTHLFAIKKYGFDKSIHFEIHAVDPNLDQRERAKIFFPNVYFYEKIEDVEIEEFDLVLNAVPIENLHEATLKALKYFRIKHLIVEKPGVARKDLVSEFNEISQDVLGLQIAYPRRVLNSSSFLRSQLANYEEWDISISYSGQPINILSHFLDLIEAVLPERQSANGINFGDINMSQTSQVNLNNHEIIFTGKSKIAYQKGGQLITIDGSITHDFSKELESQIWYSAREYLNVAIGNKISSFPRYISPLIMNVLED